MLARASPITLTYLTVSVFTLHHFNVLPKCPLLVLLPPLCIPGSPVQAPWCMSCLPGTASAKSLGRVGVEPCQGPKLGLRV
eukprot:1151689-Pelagomonas_calceolata.AAC.2